ncbi:MAG: type VII secretion protein EccE [Mycobacterium sp.]|nr:type VII secretion protein EccE [Mycobacterium sp.]
MTPDRRIGLKLQLTNLTALVTVGIITVLATASLKVQPPVTWEILAAAAAFTVMIGVVTYRSRTLLGWIGRRLRYRRSPRDTISLYEAEGIGITWDGQRACTYIEVLPQPYAITIVSGTRESVIRALPIDQIREELVQFDIHCDAVTVVTFGHNYQRPNQAATALQATIGPTPALLYGRTFIEVAITLADSLDSIYARAGTEDIPAGISRTVKIAAERIRRRVAHDGWKTQLLTKSDLAELHTHIASQLNPALAEEHWSACGPKTMRAVAFTPGPRAWTTANYREWCRLNTHRQIHIARFDRRHGTDHAEMYVGFLTSDASSLATVTALGLRREHGQQGDILTAALPLARTVRPSAVHGKPLPAETEFPIPLAPAGIGTYIGLTPNRAQVFVNFTVGSEPFYIFGPAAMCQQLLVWLSTSGRSINITLPGDEWKEFASRIGATYRTRRDADIVLAGRDELTDAAHPNQVRLVWATTPPATAPAFAIVAGPNECLLHTPPAPGALTEPIRFRWSLAKAEEAFFTIASPQRDPAPPPTRRPLQRPTPSRRPPQQKPVAPTNPESPQPGGRHAAPTRSN